MQMEDFITPKNLKRLVIAFLVFSVLVITYVLFTNLPHIGKVAVQIKYAPFASSVFIDGENYPVNNSTNYLTPGNHHILVFMDGFQILEEDINITTDTEYLYGKLIPLDENNTELVQSYNNDYLAVEGIGGQISEKTGQSQKDKWPILNYLPYIQNNYQLGTILDESNNNLSVIIHAQPAQIDNAVNKLRSFPDIELSQYDITIADFENVLESQFNYNSNPNPVYFLADGYRNLNTFCQINSGEQSGNYYYTTISVGQYAGYIPVTYRVVLEKSGDSWQLPHTPYPILTTNNTQNIDTSILNAVNRLDSPTSVQPSSSNDGH